MGAPYFVRAMLTVHLVLAIRVGYCSFVRAESLGDFLEDSKPSFDTSQPQQQLGWYLVVSTVCVITVAVAAALYTWRHLRSTLHRFPSAWGLAGSSSIPRTSGNDMDGFTVCGHLPSQADHSDREALHSKDHQSKLLHQGSSSPQADGIATAVYRMAVTQAPANPLMLPALWSPEQEAMAQDILAHARVARALYGCPDGPWQMVSSPEACTSQESDSTPLESHISGGNSGEQEAAAPAPCCDEAQCEAAAAPASKSRQHASLQPEPMYISQPPASPASMGVCIQARVLPPTGCTDTMAGEITSIGPAEVSDCQTQSAEQVSHAGRVKKPRKRWWRKLLCSTCVKA